MHGKCLYKQQKCTIMEMAFFNCNENLAMNTNDLMFRIYMAACYMKKIKRRWESLLTGEITMCGDHREKHLHLYMKNNLNESYKYIAKSVQKKNIVRACLFVYNVRFQS